MSIKKAIKKFQSSYADSGKKYTVCGHINRESFSFNNFNNIKAAKEFAYFLIKKNDLQVEDYVSVDPKQKEFICDNSRISIRQR